MVIGLCNSTIQKTKKATYDNHYVTKIDGWLLFINTNFGYHFYNEPNNCTITSSGWEGNFFRQFNGFFQTQCREREIQIKRFIDILWKTIHDHIDTLGLNQGKIGHWKKAKIQNNLNNLITYLEELAYELDKEKIEIFIRNRELSLLSKIVFMPDLILLTINYYYGSIITDIYWIDSITVHEAVLIGKGKLELSTLSKYVNSKVSSTK